jgi:predicted acyltransferase
VALAVGLATTLLGQWLAPALDSSWFWHHLVEARVPGVLFRIGICYFLAAGLYLGRGSPRVLLAVPTGILVATAVWMLYVPIPGFGRPDLGIGLWRPDGEYVGVMSNWCAYVDTRLFGVRCLHTLREAGTGALVWAFDPEGLASSVAALATVLLGILCGKWMQRPLPLLPGVKLFGLILAGFSLISGGIVLNAWIPLNKQLWTSSYVLLTAGAACSFLAVCFYAMDMRGWRRWAMPFVWYGRNAITAFFLSSLVARLIVVIKVPTAGSTGSEGTTTLAATTLTLKSWLFENLFRTWACPRNSSLFYALTVVIVWALVCGFLYRRRIFIKI